MTGEINPQSESGARKGLKRGSVLVGDRRGHGEGLPPQTRGLHGEEEPADHRQEKRTGKREQHVQRP